MTAIEPIIVDKATLVQMCGISIVEGREPRVHRMAPRPDRQKERLQFFPGVAAAMADQWGSLAQVKAA